MTELSYVLTEENKAVVIDTIERFVIKDAELLIEQLQTDLNQFRLPTKAKEPDSKVMAV